MEVVGRLKAPQPPGYAVRRSQHQSEISYCDVSSVAVGHSPQIQLVRVQNLRAGHRPTKPVAGGEDDSIIAHDDKQAVDIRDVAQIPADHLVQVGPTQPVWRA